MRGASAHLPGEQREVRDASPAAARRSGSGFRTWLRSVAPDALGPAPASAGLPRSDTDGAPNASGPQQMQASGNRSAEPDRDLSALACHLKDVTRRLGRFITGETPQPRPATADDAPD